MTIRFEGKEKALYSTFMELRRLCQFARNAIVTANNIRNFLSVGDGCSSRL